MWFLGKCMCMHSIFFFFAGIYKVQSLEPWNRCPPPPCFLHLFSHKLLLSPPSPKCGAVIKVLLSVPAGTFGSSCVNWKGGARPLLLLNEQGRLWLRTAVVRKKRPPPFLTQSTEMLSLVGFGWEELGRGKWLTLEYDKMLMNGFNCGEKKQETVAP